MAQLLAQKKLTSSRDTGGLYDIDQALAFAEWWKINDWGK